MEQKYGKVYLQERELSEDGQQIIVPKLLEGVPFGNTSQMVRSSWNLSPLYELFKSRKIFVQWNIRQKDKNGRDLDFTAKIALPIKLGELPAQDFDGCSKADQERIELWKNLGILSGDIETDSEYHCMLQRDRPTEGAAAFSAGYNVGDMKLFCTALDQLFILDDIMEQSTSQKYMPFKISQPFWSALLDVLDGKISEDNMEGCQSIFEKLPTQCHVWLKGLFAMRKELVKKTEPAVNVTQAYREFYDALLLENCSEWNQQQEHFASNTFKVLQGELRSICVGANISLEMMLFDQNIQVDNKLRESFLFKCLKKAYCDHIYLVNDVMSLKKEMNAGSSFKTIYQLHDKEGLFLDDALQKTIDKIERLDQLVDDTGELFIGFFAENLEAAKFVHAIKCAMYGNIQWGAITNRYDPEMIFDCVVEL